MSSPTSSPCFLCINARSSSSAVSPVTCASEDASRQLVVTGHSDGSLFIWHKAPAGGGDTAPSYSVACICSAHPQVPSPPTSRIFLQRRDNAHQAVTAVALACPLLPLSPLVISCDPSGLMVCR